LLAIILCGANRVADGRQSQAEGEKDTFMMSESEVRTILSSQGGLAHELNNDLTIALVCCDLLADMKLDADAQKHVQLLLDTCRRMARRLTARQPELQVQ